MELFEGTGIAMAIFLALLVVGVLAYYVNRRVAGLERVVQKQSQVITGFIGGVRGELVGSELGAARRGPSEEAPSPRAEEAAACWAGGCCQPRVEVSDDETSLDETGSSEESDTSDDETPDAPRHIHGLQEADDDSATAKNDDGGGMRLVNIGTENDLDRDEISVVMNAADPGPVVAQLVAGDSEEADGSGTSDTDSCLSEPEGIDGGVDDVSEHEDVPIEEGHADAAVDDEQSPSGEVEGAGGAPGSDGEGDKPITKRTLPELRDLVVEKNLLSRTEAKKLRKSGLISILEPTLASDS